MAWGTSEALLIWKDSEVGSLVKCSLRTGDRAIASRFEIPVTARFEMNTVICGPLRSASRCGRLIWKKSFIF
jgi:hypothetical protein